MSGNIIMSENSNGEVRYIKKEAIGAAASVKSGLGGPVVVAVIGKVVAAVADSLGLAGGDEIGMV